MEDLFRKHEGWIVAQSVGERRKHASALSVLCPDNIPAQLAFSKTTAGSVAYTINYIFV
jgi:hypothetical protein